MSRWHLSPWLVFGLTLLLISLPGGARAEEKGPSTPPPEEVVKSYLTAMKGGDFATAYELLSPDMRGSDPKDAWVLKQNAIMKIADVQITSFEVQPAKIDGKRAMVPNLLNSKDKFINQTGLIEYELYTLLQADDGTWHIDQQQLVETDAMEKWFPGRKDK
jgi:hypothetical protein